MIIRTDLDSSNTAEMKYDRNHSVTPSRCSKGESPLHPEEEVWLVSKQQHMCPLSQCSKKPLGQGCEPHTPPFLTYCKKHKYFYSMR